MTAEIAAAESDRQCRLHIDRKVHHAAGHARYRARRTIPAMGPIGAIIAFNKSEKLIWVEPTKEQLAHHIAGVFIENVPGKTQMREGD